MNVIEHLKKTAATNAENPRFAPIDDEYLGKRIDVGFVSLIRENGNPCQCFLSTYGTDEIGEVPNADIVINTLPKELNGNDKNSNKTV